MPHIHSSGYLHYQVHEKTHACRIFSRHVLRTEADREAAEIKKLVNMHNTAISLESSGIHMLKQYIILHTQCLKLFILAEISVTFDSSGD